MSTQHLIERIAAGESSAGSFAKHYFARLKELLDGIEVDDISRLAGLLDGARKAGHTVFVAGNGGSATTASSMANDLGFDIIKKTGTTLPFRMLALTDNNAVMTAVANDVGYDQLFVSQLRVHYRPGDILIVISASGNSPNVVRAAEFVRDQGGKVIGMLGFKGGKLREMCDLALHVASESGEYGPVEDAHLVINHVLAHWFQVRLRDT